MCLTSKETKPYIATEDIICYKVVHCNKDDGKVYTPFMNAVVDEDILKGNGVMLPEGEPRVTTTTTVEGGYIHSYAKIQEVELCSALSMDDRRVYKCVIPAGSKYWIGSDGDYASSALKFVRLVENSETKDGSIFSFFGKYDDLVNYKSVLGKMGYPFTMVYDRFCPIFDASRLDFYVARWGPFIHSYYPSLMEESGKFEPSEIESLAIILEKLVITMAHTSPCPENIHYALREVLCHLFLKNELDKFDCNRFIRAIKYYNALAYGVPEISISIIRIYNMIDELPPAEEFMEEFMPIILETERLNARIQSLRHKMYEKANEKVEALGIDAGIVIEYDDSCTECDVKCKNEC